MQTGTIWCHDRLIRFLIAEHIYLHVVTLERLNWYNFIALSLAGIILDFITIIIIMFGEYSVVLWKTAYIKFCHIALYWTMVSWANAMWVPPIYVPRCGLVLSLCACRKQTQYYSPHTKPFLTCCTHGLVQLDTQPAIHAHNSTIVLLHNMSHTN